MRVGDAMGAVVLFGCSACAATPEDGEPRDAALELASEVEIGPAWADSSINVSIFRESAILRVGERVAVAYYDPEGFARVDVLAADLSRLGSLRIVPRIEERLLGDGHCVISMGATPNGDIALVYGAHAAGTIAYQAAIAGPLLADPPNGAELTATAWPHTITYPQFYRIGDALQLYFRKDAGPGGTAESDVAVAQWNDDARALAPTFTRLLPAGADRSVYMERMAVDGDRAALLWMYRKPPIPAEDPPVVRNEGMYLAMTHDGAQTWSTLSSSPMTFPLAKDPGALGFDMGLDSRPMNQTSAAFGPDGILYDAQMHLDADGIYQVFLVQLELATGAWHEDVMSDNEEAFDLAGAGTLVLPLSRPDIAVSDRYLHVIYRQDEAIVVASRPHAADAGWGYSRFDVPDLGAWEPNFDPAGWSTRGELLLFVQPVRQAEGDHADAGAPTPAEIWRFTER